MPADVEIEPGLSAEDLCETDAERAALLALREAVGKPHGPIERHGLRMLFICERMADDRNEEVDRELLLVAGLLHDVGLYDAASKGGVYVTDGREYTAEVLAGCGWDPEREQLCLDAIEHHHNLRPQWQLGPEVELMRRADLVELSANVIRFDLDRGWLRRLNRAIPRDGAYREVTRRLLAIARDRPSTLPKIFVAGR